jgi:protein-disulfide isomerase
MPAAAAYSRPVIPVPVRRPWSPRVYYIAAVAITATLAWGEAHGQVDLTAAPSMVKGPPDAPVTIVEFSDYQ